MTQTLLLTGCSGFIAKHVALALLTEGFALRGTLRDLGRAKEIRRALAPHLAEDAMARLTFVPADLMADAGWAAAMQGVDAVVHTASPFPLSQPKDAAALIRPAVDGTLRVLGAAHAAGVRRVVLTSSTAAIIPAERAGAFDEADWADATLSTTSPYARSKILAEHSAWDFAATHGMNLTTINPGLVLGAPLDAAFGSSVALIQRIAKGRDPMLPNIDFPVVDVVDVARMHLRAVQDPETAGQRFAAVAGTLSMVQMGQILKSVYPTRRIPTRAAPAILLRVLARFDSGLAAILPSLDKAQRVRNTRAVTQMDMRFTPAKEALMITANWLEKRRLIWV